MLPQRAGFYPFIWVSGGVNCVLDVIHLHHNFNSQAGKIEIGSSIIKCMTGSGSLPMPSCRKRLYGCEKVDSRHANRLCLIDRKFKLDEMKREDEISPYPGMDRGIFEK